MVDDAHARVSQMRQVERIEGIEALAVDLRGAISAQQLAAEIDANFGHAGASVGVLGCSYLDARDEVLTTISAQLVDGQLRAREDNRLCQVLKHE